MSTRLLFGEPSLAFGQGKARQAFFLQRQAEPSIIFASKTELNKALDFLQN